MTLGQSRREAVAFAAGIAVAFGAYALLFAAFMAVDAIAPAPAARVPVGAGRRPGRDAPTPPAPSGRASEVRFSPGGGCEAEVVRRVGQARREVRVLAFSFTSDAIGQALIDASRRGVDVRVVVDKGQPRAAGGEVARLVEAGVPVLVDAKHAIQHNKVIVVDGAIVLNGSYNFTASAESRNAENLRTEVNDPLAPAYLEDWSRHAAHSTPARPVSKR